MNSLLTTRRAANWMMGLGILYVLIAVALGIGAGAAVFDSAKRGGDWAGLGYLIGLVAGAVAVVVLAVAVALLIAQGFVRQGSRRAMMAGIVVSVLALPLPVLPVCLLMSGNFQSHWQLVGLGAGVILLTVPAWSIWVLLKARRETKIQ